MAAMEFFWVFLWRDQRDLGGYWCGNDQQVVVGYWVSSGRDQRVVVGFWRWRLASCLVSSGGDQ